MVRLLAVYAQQITNSQMRVLQLLFLTCNLPALDVLAYSVSMGVGVKCGLADS
jgi:hypothetical protein